MHTEERLIRCDLDKICSNPTPTHSNDSADATDDGWKRDQPETGAQIKRRDRERQWWAKAQRNPIYRTMAFATIVRLSFARLSRHFPSPLFPHSSARCNRLWKVKVMINTNDLMRTICHQKLFLHSPTILLFWRPFEFPFHFRLPFFF